MNIELNVSGQPNKKLLAVDDDPGVLLMAEEVFLARNFEVYTVASGEQALAQIAQINPDIILLDIMMPGLDGFETCARIKQTPGFADVPIIMLTGREDVAAVERAYDAGAWDFSSKPVHWPLLSHRVDYCLRAFEAFSSERRAAQLSKTLDKSSNEIIGFDAHTLKIVSANASALDNLRYSVDAIKRFTISDVCSGLSQNAVKHRLRGLAHQQQIHVSLDLKRRDGSTYPVDGIILYNTDDEPHSYVAIFQDITERKKTEQELHRLAYFDELTGLPNRRLFQEHTQKSLSSARRREELCAVCILDLDSFKSINDALGHSRGDLLLKQVSDRLATEVRQYDTVARLGGSVPEDNSELQLARLGGDEFIILLNNFEHPSAPAKVADRILKTLSLPYNLHGQELSITASIGIALYPDDGENLEVLMQRADNAMYAAKNMGKNSYAYFSQEQGMNSLDRLTLETELRRALKRDELELYYQPQIDGRTLEVVGVEALLRWNHPEKGLLGPFNLIPVAEETGLIIPIGDWVLRTALEQLGTWAEKYGPDFKCAVNISGMQVRQDDFLVATRDMLAPAKQQQGRLVLELTESSIMTTNQSRLEWLREIRELGVEIAIDDFGTGYSSLSYLKKLPLDYLKIDRSFIMDLATDNDDRVITNTIFQMARALSLNVVVEGVETSQQLQLVNDMGPCLIQGYLYSPPLSVTDLEAWISGFDAANMRDSMRQDALSLP